MSHQFSVFANSCLSVPLDPITKMPKTAYERKQKSALEQSSIESASSRHSTTPPVVEAEVLKEFYKSIPDYNELEHLPTEEFNATLRKLREKKRAMFRNLDHIDADNVIDHSAVNSVSVTPIVPKKSKSKLNTNVKKRYSNNGKSNHADFEKSIFKLDPQTKRNASFSDLNQQLKDNLKISSIDANDIFEVKGAESKQKRNHSSCSITWQDSNIENKQVKDDIDDKFAEFFNGTTYSKDYDDDFKTRSMPSSPLRHRIFSSPIRRRRSITIPKPFKMTERDEDARKLKSLRKFGKSFSADMLDIKQERRVFRANPVPIESRILLYDQIMEDQAMRFYYCNNCTANARTQRAISKINSEAELRAKVRPFSFTKREEKVDICSHALPKPRRRRFRARPVPRNLFSNYIYEKRKEDEFFRSMNRKIRAEELLRSSSLPASMAVRERSHLSTPAAHSDLPTDPSPGVPSASSSSLLRARSPTKNKRTQRRNDFITTSPQPFRLTTAERAAKKMEDLTKKIYQDTKSTPSVDNSDGRTRVYSALDLRAHATGRSNLAALLRAENVKKKFEMEAAKRLQEQRQRMEMRTRDRMLRSKPAWHMVKNNYEEDIAMRLQTRRDEERLRREEYLHEMELMYGRVHKQPMLFERYYAPRRYVAADSIQLTPKRKNKNKKNKHSNYPKESREASIDRASYNGNVLDYLNRLDKHLQLDSDGGTDCAK